MPAAENEAAAVDEAAAEDDAGTKHEAAEGVRVVCESLMGTENTIW